VVAVDSGRALAEALARPSTRIVVSTLQKFPVADQLQAIGGTTGGRYAVLVDEAHSSQSGDGARHLKSVLSGGGPVADDTLGGTGGAVVEYDATAAAADVEVDATEALAEAIARSAAGRKLPANVSIFAFTATPKGKTLELFGTPAPDGTRRPFHLYSMRQAIEEGFILDPLQRYTTYETMWRVTTDSGREVDRSRASAAIAKYATMHEAMLDEKAEVVVEHYREHVRHLLDGRAKAMVVTRSRLAAVRYKQRLDRYIAAHGADVGVVVAFSGAVTDPVEPGQEHTEASLNGFPEAQTVRRFREDHHLLVVAEKYQTGFDEPLLQAMYVDKKLEGVAAVQTLGRLNRTAPGKEPPFVLDFVNSAEDIADAFAPYYGGAVGVPTDHQLLYEVWQRLEETRVLDEADLQAFAAVFFTATPGDLAGHPALYAALEPAQARFAALGEEAQEQVRTAATQFVRMYGFLAQVLPYVDEELERAHPYVKMLLRRISTGRGAALDLSDDLALSHLRLSQPQTSQIGLTSGDDPLTSFSGTGQGALTAAELVLLREVVDRINERFGAAVTEDDRIFYHAVAEHMAAETSLQQQAAANDLDAFAFAFEDAFASAVVDVMEHNSDLGKRLLDDRAYAEVVKTWLLRYVHRRAAERHRAPELLGAPDAPGQAVVPPA
jgi:type I restriction enzyme, R subunit